MALTAALVNLFVANNATWQDAFQFGVIGDTSWSFTGMTFKLEVKASRDDSTALLTAQSSDGSIVVDDETARTLHMNVPDTTIQTDLPVAEYVYDLIMLDGSTPAIRTPLMEGRLVVTQGVTRD